MKIIDNKSNDFIATGQKNFYLNERKMNEDKHSTKFELIQKNKQTIINIYSHLIEDDNYKLLLNGVKLTLIISQKRELDIIPLRVKHPNRIDFDNTVSEKLQSFEYTLPKNNYFIKRTSWDKNKKLLKVILKKKTYINDFGNI